MEKVFEALSRIEECWYDDPYTDREDNLTYEDDIDTIKQVLLKAQEQKKALKIIKEKEVDVNLLNIRHSVETYNDDYYKIHYSYDVAGYLLTEEEFNLLKEVLK